MSKSKIDASVIKQIHNLRRKGCSIPEISRFCRVSKSTAFRYAHKVSISPRFFERWRNKRITSTSRSAEQWQAARNWARVLVPELNMKEYALLAASLYWAEGAKRDFSFSNTDAQMIRSFMQILRVVFEVQEEAFTISIRLYQDLNRVKCLKYWSEITGIDLTERVSVNVVRGAKKGKLEFGMCRIRVRKPGLLLKKLKAIRERISELSPRSSMD